MSYILSVIFFLLSMVIFCFTQISSGLFSIFYHFRLAKTSKKQADDAALSYILGTEIFATAIWLVTYITIFCLNFDSISPIFLWLMAGICLADAVIILIFYFCRNKSQTTTFISRRIANNLINNAMKTKSRSDAIILGFVSCLPDFIFTLPIYIVCSTFLQSENAIPRAVIIILAVIISVIPHFVIRTFFQTDHNLAEIQRFRIKLKPHFRFMLFLAYIAAALTLTNYAMISQ